MKRLHAWYPFLEEARSAVEAAGIDLAELVQADDPAEVARAVERIEDAVLDGRVSPPIGDDRVELLSYPIARVLVSLVDIPVLTDRYALAEARRAFDLLDRGRSDGLRSGTREGLSKAHLLAEFDIARVTEDTAEFVRVPVTRYLTLTTELGGRRWRLVSRALANGQVAVNRRELDVLLREAIRERVVDGLPLDVPQSIADALTEEVNEIEGLLADIRIPEDVDTVVPELFPPCMRVLLDRLRAGGDMADIERFAIVTFLAAIGLEPDETLAFVDLDRPATEQALRYQLEHVHGRTRSTAYPPPSCATLQAAGACVDDPNRCAADGHALTAYVRRIDEAGDPVDWRDREQPEPA